MFYHISADINKVPFEIGRAFYPPPNITLPEINIPPPSEVKVIIYRILILISINVYVLV